MEGGDVWELIMTPSNKEHAPSDLVPVCLISCTTFVKVLCVPPSCLAQVCNLNKNTSSRLPESELRTAFSNILLRLSHGSHRLGWRRLVPW